MLLQASGFDPALLLVFSIPLFALLMGLLAIYWDHKRKMRMIEEGLVSDEEELLEESDSWWVLAVGLVLAAVGAGVMVESWLRGDSIDGVVYFLLGVAALVYFLVKWRVSGGETWGLGTCGVVLDPCLGGCLPRIRGYYYQT